METQCTWPWDDGPWKKRRIWGGPSQMLQDGPVTSPPRSSFGSLSDLIQELQVFRVRSETRTITVVPLFCKEAHLCRERLSVSASLFRLLMIFLGRNRFGASQPATQLQTGDYMMLLNRCLAILCVGLVAIVSTTHANENVLKTTVDPYDVDWDYSDGPNGPAHWGDLNPRWRTCSEGQNQSPINIDTSKLVYEEDLDAPAIHEYTDTPAYVLNNGHAAQVIWPAGWLYVNGKNYSMTGFQFHSPSEHTIDCKSYPLEMQIVHQSDDGDYAIVVVLSSVQDMVNGWVAQFWDKIPADSIWQPVLVGVLSPNGFRVNFSKYYRYIGSLTAPDCQENVVWTVLSTVYEISPGQLEHLRSVFPCCSHVSKNTETGEVVTAKCVWRDVYGNSNANNRPIQPLGDRKVSYPKASV